MKKVFAIILSVSLILAALALPAMAEETQNAAMTASTLAGRGNGPQGGRGPGGQRQNGQKNGQMPGQNGNSENGQQAPAMPGQNGNNANGQQAPAMPGQNGGEANGQAPAMPGDPANGSTENGQQAPAAPENTGAEADAASSATSQNGQQAPQKGMAPQGKMGGHRGGKDARGMNGKGSFENLLKNGVIDQNTYNAIMDYMKQHAPAGAPNGQAQDGTTPPAMPEGEGSSQAQDGTTPPAMPEGAEGTTPPEKPEGENGQAPQEDDLLKKLVEEGILTQEQADAVAAAQTAAAADSAAEITEKAAD